MAIPAQFIDELNRRLDIVDVVGDYVSLNRKGGNLWGLCPFHGEKTPSFSVSPDKQIYHCFGCGKGGGAINFVMEIENLPFPDAVRQLAKKVGMEVPESQENGAFRKRRERLLALNKEAARFFHAGLQSEAGAPGREYLFGRRGLSPQVVTRFGLGWAPEGWDNLMTAMIQLGYQKAELLEAGLVVDSKKGRIYDRFRGRVMFPIIDLRGDVIGFGGRVLDDSTPKYLNSPDTPVFHKGRNLFALNLAKKTKLGRIILTEGYMDTISLHQAGFDCAVASLGTALTPEHAQLLARYTKEAVIAYDGDGAGVKAANRSIPILEKTGIKVKVLRMQGAKDPDEYIKKFGADAFRRLLDQSENHIEYRIEEIRRKFELSDPVQKVDFLKEAVALVATLPSAVEREVYGGRCAQLADVTPEAVAQEVKRELARRIKREAKQQERKDLTPNIQLQPKERALRYENLRSARAEAGILRLILLDATLLQKTGDLAGDQFTAPLLGRVFDLLKQRWQEGLAVDLPSLAGDLTPEEMNHLTSIAGEPQSMERSSQALCDYIECMKNERARTIVGQGDDLLRAAQKKMLEKKSMGD